MNRFFRAISVLEGSFEEDRIDPATQDRINRQNIVIVSLPDPSVFVEISRKIGRSESARKDQIRLSQVDNKILISSIWKYKKVVTADRRLAERLVKHKSSVRNLAIIRSRSRRDARNISKLMYAYLSSSLSMLRGSSWNVGTR